MMLFFQLVLYLELHSFKELIDDSEFGNRLIIPAFKKIYIYFSKLKRGYIQICALIGNIFSQFPYFIYELTI